MDVRTIGEALGLRVTDAQGARAVVSVVSDSREAGKDSLFVCVRGARADGHDFAEAVCKAGASAVLCERPLEDVASRYPDVAFLVVPDSVKALGAIAAAWRQRFRGKVIGVTGTAGKTTLKEWLALALSLEALENGSGKGCAKTSGNHNNQLGMPLCVCGTTGEEAYWVIECGVSREGDMEELAGILRPDVGVVLNAGEGHTEGLGARGVAWHKTRMFTLLAENGACVASADYASLAKEARDANPSVLLFSADRNLLKVPMGRLSALGCRLCGAADGLSCHVTLRYKGKEATYSLRLPFAGPAAAENCVCLCLTLAAAGVPLNRVESLAQRAMTGATLPGHRFLREKAGGCLLIDDTYNANPLSMARMIEAAEAESDAMGVELGLVLGAMGELGDVAERAHRELGGRISALKPAFVLWKGAYADCVREGLGAGIPFVPCATHEELERGLREQLTPERRERGMTLLLKGSRSNALEKTAAFARTLLTDGDNN